MCALDALTTLVVADAALVRGEGDGNVHVYGRPASEKVLKVQGRARGAVTRNFQL